MLNSRLFDRGRVRDKGILYRIDPSQYGQELLGTVDRLIRYSQDKGYLS